jgi:hypothetical protein
MSAFIEQSDYIVSQIQDSAQNRLVVIEHVLSVLDSQLAVLNAIMSELNYADISIKVDETPAQ